MTNHTFKTLAALLLFTALAHNTATPQAHNASSASERRLDVSSATSATASSELAIGRSIEADMAFLASDELHGRGSATRDEHLAALYTASQFQAIGLEPAGDDGTYIQKSPVPDISQLPEGFRQYWEKFQKIERKETWNTIAILPGTDPKLRAQAILLTAHQDHLGIGPDVSGDSIYNGADDDASGTSAVLELARMLTRGKPPRRTIIFALFGSEEMGGYGNRAFLADPPVPIKDIVANLEFEMIGRPDPAVAAGMLWLTGYERSNLGPELARHGAHLVADPHPKENFFQRSDNYALARKGIVAQTVSSFGLHKDYHQPSDDLSHIDFAYMTQAVTSMIGPVRWLADSTFKPSWNPGGQPKPAPAATEGKPAVTAQ